MQAICGTIEADIADQRPGGEPGVERVPVGALLHVAALFGGGEEGRAGRGHRREREPRRPRMGPVLYHNHRSATIDGTAVSVPAPARSRRVIGLMSGTSLDGVDAAFLITDGRGQITPGPAITVPYEAALKEGLRRVLGGRGPIAEVERALTHVHAETVRVLIERHELESVELIGFHGHTILHRPEEGRTWQIGDGGLLAQLTGIDVVADFRSADMAAGGEGAPLAPLYHRALAGRLPRPIAVLNLGGVANVTWLGTGADEILAFDTGPGNALIDDWALAHTGRAIDEGGALAARGRIDKTALERFLAHPYFERLPPKSLDRDDFAACVPAGLGAADGAATLTAMTAAAVARGRPRIFRRRRGAGWSPAAGGIIRC